MVVVGGVGIGVMLVGVGIGVVGGRWCCCVVGLRMSCCARSPSGVLAGVTAEAVMISLSGSSAMWPLYPSWSDAAAFAAVAGVGVRSGDQTVFGHTAHQMRKAVRVFVDVLTQHDFQQPGCVAHRVAEPQTVQDPQTPEGVAGEVCDDPGSGFRVEPIAFGFVSVGVIIHTHQHFTQPVG